MAQEPAKATAAGGRQLQEAADQWMPVADAATSVMAASLTSAQALALVARGVPVVYAEPI